jgi:hypothetical protein
MHLLQYKGFSGIHLLQSQHFILIPNCWHEIHIYDVNSINGEGGEGGAEV